jgi:predicted RNA-binding Zn-ribbon protein involved in translation (DUF1610 family)
MHKIILSGTREFFKQILLKNPHPNPLIYIKVKHKLLYSILKFVYLGQCEIEQSDIESFLEWAKDLQISGLCSEQEEDVSTTIEKAKISTEGEKETEPQFLGKVDLDLKNYTPDLKTFPVQGNTFGDENIKEEDIVPGQVERPQDKDADGFTCNQCGKVLMCKEALSVHKINSHRKKYKKDIQSNRKTNLSEDLSFCTKRDRLLNIKPFKKYVFDQAGKPFDEVLSGEDGREVLQEMFFGFFSTLRKRNGKLPSEAYISKLRSSINCAMIEEYKLDLVNRQLCPGFNQRWKDIISQFKEFVCPKCGMEFAERIKLKEHRDIHKSANTHNCEICEGSFSDIKGLSRHMNNKHSVSL